MKNADNVYCKQIHKQRELKKENTGLSENVEWVVNLF